MAKEIKAIKCPNCGSVSKTEIKPDFYKCDSCQTEYFLDNDDVNINHNHNYNTPKADPVVIRKLLIVIGSAFAFIILVGIVSSLFSNPMTPYPDNSTYSAPSTEAEKDDPSFHASRYNSSAFVQPSSQKPIVMMLESRRYNAQKNKIKDGTYLVMYDPLEKKLLAEEKVAEKDMYSSDLRFRRFSDGNIYITNDKTSLLKLNQETLKTEAIGQKFFEANDELQIGVATLEFVTETRGDGLILLTNDGKKRYYYPLIQKLYTEDEFYKAYAGFNTLLPNSKTKTIHVFTKKSSEFPEEKIQLIKLDYKDNGPGPKDVPKYMSWGKDYGRSGIFYGGEPYKKRLLNAYLQEAQRVLKLKDLTPDRLYFDASVLVDDDDVLIIQFRVNANTTSGYKFQQIDRETGAVIWTSEFPEGEAIEKLTRYKSGLLGINRNHEMLVLDSEGNITSDYKLK